MLFHGVFCKDALRIDFDEHTVLEERQGNKRLSSRDNMSATNTVEVLADVSWSKLGPGERSV